MEALKREENKEKTREKLNDTKEMLDVTVNRLCKMEQEYKYDKAQYQKQLKNLQNIQMSQATRLEKANFEVRNMEAVTSLRTAEKESLKKMSEELKEELEKLKNANKAEIMNLHSVIEDLEKQITNGYMQLELAKDVELLLQLGFTSLPANIQEPLVREILRIKTEAVTKRKQDIEKVEQAIKDKEKEIKEKKEELALMKEKYASLNQVYDMAKKVVKPK